MKTEFDIVVEQYMELPYRMEVYFDDDYWAVEFPELPGLVAGHETWEGLRAVIDDAKRSYFTTALEQGQAIPRPVEVQENFSGKVMVRLPKSIHRAAVKRARLEGVSLNSLIMVAVAKEVGWVTSAMHRSTSADHVDPGVLNVGRRGGIVQWDGQAVPPKAKWINGNLRVARA